MHRLILLLLPCSLFAAPRPNIVLLMADDMGWGDPSYNSGQLKHPDAGWIHTPHLDQLAADGVRFDRFYSASAVCSPTRGAMLTGRNPFRLGIPYANSGHLKQEEVSLPELLTDAGYRCGHFGKWHLGTLTTVRKDANRGRPGTTEHYSAPWHHGYHTCYVTESKVPTWHVYRKAKNGAALPTSFDDPTFYGTYFWEMPADPNAPEGRPVPPEEINNAQDGDASRLIVREANAFIRASVEAEKPFFAVIWYHTPHKPLVDPEGRSSVDSSDACKDSIEDLDDSIGMLRETLQELGVADQTMIWFTSDNGPENGVDAPQETNPRRSLRSGLLFQRKRSLHEGGIRVPGIVTWPGTIEPGATKHPAVTSDVWPTVVDWLELAVPEPRPIDGVSLRKVLEGDHNRPRPQPVGFLIQQAEAWIDGPWKLIRGKTGAPWQLYHLETDRGETRDLAQQQPERVKELENAFTAWRTNVAADR